MTITHIECHFAGVSTIWACHTNVHCEVAIDKVKVRRLFGSHDPSRLFNSECVRHTATLRVRLVEDDAAE